MLKTIKTTKKVDFFELVKGVQTGIYKHGDYRVVGGNEGSVWVDLGGFILEEPDNKILFTDSFTVEVEEEVTEDTVFDTLVDVNNNDEVHIAWNDSISLYDKEQTKEIHALINGKLELIYERNDGSSQCTV